MRHISELERPTRPTVATIGNFDGVHRGHQALLTRSQEIAKTLDLAMVAMTFEPHPLEILRPGIDPYLLTPVDLKLDYLRGFRVPWVDVIPFTMETASIPPLAFLELYLAQRLHAAAVVVGYNFTFGARGLGTPDTIREWGKGRQIRVDVVAPVVNPVEGQVVSSSVIREAVRNGQVDVAQLLLGHPFAVQGIMVSGDARGRTMGVPTVNILPPSKQVMPPFGVYAGILDTGHKRHHAAANWGIRPTFGGGDPVLEIHVLEKGDWQFTGSLRFEFIQYLRPEQKFASTAELVAQIGRDLTQAQDRLQGLS